MSILCDTCGKPAKSHYCWFQDGSNSKFHPSEKRDEASSETRLREGLRELAEDAEFNQNRPLLKRIRALLSLEGDKAKPVLGGIGPTIAESKTD